MTCALSDRFRHVLHEDAGGVAVTAKDPVSGQQRCSRSIRLGALPGSRQCMPSTKADPNRHVVCVPLKQSHPQPHVTGLVLHLVTSVLLQLVTAVLLQLLTAVLQPLPTALLLLVVLAGGASKAAKESGNALPACTASPVYTTAYVLQAWDDQVHPR